jgi:predicted nucleotide-binding protein
MARRPASAQKQPAQLSADELRAGITRLKRRLDELEQFDPQQVTDRWNNPALTQLTASIDDALVRTFGADTLDYDRYRGASYLNEGPIVMGGYEPPIQEIRDELEHSKADSRALLEQAIRSLEEQISELPAKGVESGGPSPSELSSDVFIVHGHAEGPRETIARFVQSIGLNPIILHERPNKGRTIITKFREEAKGVGFAIVVMTPDDQGSVVGGDLQSRARQNVVFELGFFIGALGSDRVAAVLSGNIERPSDFDGVVYIPFEGDWRVKLGRELQAAGYDVDWNKVMA